MKRAHLPLTALRSFEAAGRHQSFTLAANELFVSQAAISRQIRELETSLGHSLFERLAQRVVLTSAGVELLVALTPAFDAMDTALSKSTELYASTELAITVEPGFASCWLLPRLKQFQSAFPNVEIAMETDERVIEFRSHEPQLAIRFSAKNSSWKNTQAKHLFDMTLIPVISPNMLGADQAVKSVEALMSQQLLHEAGARAWRYWCAEAGIDYISPNRGQTFDNMGLILQAVLNGHGTALVDQIFAAPYIVSGELICPFDIPIILGAYWLVTPNFSELSPIATQFVSWMQREANSETPEVI